MPKNSTGMIITRYRNIIIILKHCAVNFVSELILDSVKLISKIYIYFCFKLIYEMINPNIFIIKIFIQNTQFIVSNVKGTK
jgi:hypothetical protein